MAINNSEPPCVGAVEECIGERKTNNCTSTCCSGSEVPARQEQDAIAKTVIPSCCKDKPSPRSPCCDAFCLDRIALRECSTSAPSSAAQDASCSRSNGNGTDTPCETHRRSARQKYAARLDAIGCICRALLALGQDSCCLSPAPERRSTDSVRSLARIFSGDSCCKKDLPKHRGPNSRAKGCSSGCCGRLEPTANVDERHPITLKKRNVDAGDGSKGCRVTAGLPSATEGKLDPRKSSKGSCAPGPLLTAERYPDTDACSKSCCNGPGSASAATQSDWTRQDSGDTNACSDVCCIKSGDTSVVRQCAITAKPPCEDPDKIEVLPDTAIADPEKGIIGKEHIILSISGMTCTGCETKLKRTMGTLRSISNLKTSLVLSRAEFDLDVRDQSLAEVIKHMERTTEFKYERVTDHGSSVEILVPDASVIMKQDWPRGVTEVALVNKHTVNISFDAKVTGARDLVEHGWDRRLTLAAPRADPSLDAGRKHVRYVGWMTLLSAILTIPVLVMAWAPLPEREMAYSSASLALASIVQFVIAGPFYPKALKALIFSRIIEMDLLIVLSTSAAYIFSVVSFAYVAVGKPLSTGEFFETSTLLVTLIMVGRYIAALARQKAVESISFRSLQMPTAILVDEITSSEKEVDVRLLQYGDIFKVLPDSKIPTDGTVISGTSEVDESMITGETTPVEKCAKAAVVAGSVNGSGVLIARLTRLPADNTISMIAGMVDQAKLSKPKIQDIADRVASYFVPVVVALTVIVFAIWIAVGIAVRNQSGSRATTEAITYAITVLIVSCPCAIGLAVPMVVVIVSGIAAERGIIFKTADSIEVAHKASHIVFDKTGTLTQGKLAVKVEHIIDEGDTSLPLLLGLIGSNKHPISKAVTAHLKEKGVQGSIVADQKVLTGKGVESSTPGFLIRAGNSHWLNQSSHPQVLSALRSGYTVFCFTINDSLVAIFGLQDSLRPGAFDTVNTLHERGISVHILSGDDYGAVRSIAAQLQIPDSNVRARCTPADKQTYIQSLAVASTASTPSTNPPVTIFVGDGTNDAPALAQSTIGIHLPQEETPSSTATAELAKSAADIVLLRPQLNSILSILQLSKRANRRIAFNFGWSFMYNLFAILFAAGAFVHVHVRIPPAFAGLGELVSVLPVVVAAVLLRFERV
ncbi:cation-transporting P-type ATPase PCA1 [Aspergillus undulatus]|uniref:cation-transporting P-type ATPase PCA1 n=1 Tax=Aspergillus undulatus TaxID=1810928 RepID=UPI003CCDD6C9